MNLLQKAEIKTYRVIIIAVRHCNRILLLLLLSKNGSMCEKRQKRMKAITLSVGTEALQRTELRLEFP